VLALLATRDFASWSVEPSCSSFANPRDTKVSDELTPFQATCVQHLSPASPFSGRLLLRHLSTTWSPPNGCATCSTSPRRSALHDLAVKKNFFQPPNPRYAIPRGGSDPTVLPWLRSNGLDLLPCSSRLGTSWNQEFGLPSELTNPEFTIS
jgi:hypothetical protein